MRMRRGGRRGGRFLGWGRCVDIELISSQPMLGYYLFKQTKQHIELMLSCVWLVRLHIHVVLFVRKGSS